MCALKKWGEDILIDERSICAICAWRGDCQKRFNFESSGQLRCPDYTRDVSIKSEEEEQEE